MIEDVEDSFDQIIPSKQKGRQSLLSIQKTSIESTQPERLQTATKECRICLQPEERTDNQLQSPCKCIGSVRYVHDLCYRKWISRMYESKDRRSQNKMMDQGIQCQLCKETIDLNFTNKCSCVSCPRFKQKISKSTFVFVLFLFFLMINAGSMSYLFYYTFSNLRDFKDNMVTLILVVASFVFLGLTLAVTLYYFVSDYLVEKIWVLESYAMRSREAQPKQNMRYQVHPMPSVEELAD